ncbi:ammonium transporter [Streptococcus pluranimalium]|uniref:ammonium transporter n=1 Tax=Streptococcus pluranimalium TaxID=82348 RepID=UPI003F690B9F
MFLLICSLMMWLMIFGLGLMYVGYLSPRLSNRIMFQYTITMLWTSFLWVAFAYFISFQGQLDSVFLSHHLPTNLMLELFCQLCFALYAVGMMIGATIDRIKTHHLILLSSAWLLLVYCPLAYLIWNPAGWLARLGVVDFSGGLVVHLSAGLSSLVLAKLLGNTPHEHSNNQHLPLYLGMLFITFGWFSFNMAPVGQLNDKSVLIAINTLVAIISGGLAWSLLAKWHKETNLTVTTLNGVIVGLVTSTSAVGMANPLEMMLICGAASSLTYLMMTWIQKTLLLDDVVDSFAMNGLGGLLGSLGVIAIAPETALPQIIGILVTIVVSGIVTLVVGKMIFRT